MATRRLGKGSGSQDSLQSKAAAQRRRALHLAHGVLECHDDLENPFCCRMSGMTLLGAAPMKRESDAHARRNTVADTLQDPFRQLRHSQPPVSPLGETPQ